MASKLTGHVCSNKECGKKYEVGQLPRDRRCTDCGSRITDLYEEAELELSTVESPKNRKGEWEINFLA